MDDQSESAVLSARPWRVLVLSGPNLNLLGAREPEIYGTTTLEQIHGSLADLGRTLLTSVECRQSNHEGELVTWIQEARGGFDGLLVNPAAYGHTSVALRDALSAVGLPCVEVHLSLPENRESFRHVSLVTGACVGRVAGFGPTSYLLGLRGLIDYLRTRRAG